MSVVLRDRMAAGVLEDAGCAGGYCERERNTIAAAACDINMGGPGSHAAGHLKVDLCLARVEQRYTRVVHVHGSAGQAERQRKAGGLRRPIGQVRAKDTRQRARRHPRRIAGRVGDGINHSLCRRQARQKTGRLLKESESSSN